MSTSLGLSYALALVLGLALTPSLTMSAPFPTRSFEQVEVFATCAGRYQAAAALRPTVEGSAQYAAEMQEIVSLLLPSAEAEGMPTKQAELWRRAAWADMVYYITEAQMSFDPVWSETAFRAAASGLEACDRLIPSQ